MVSAIQDVEKEVKHSRTIVMGDFNCSPFDVEMISKNKMNVVLFKKLINKAEMLHATDVNIRDFITLLLNILPKRMSPMALTIMLAMRNLYTGIAMISC